jgi:hypothetical protein
MKQTPRTNRRLLMGTAILICIGLFTSGYFSNPPNGYTGAPGDSTCASCHSGGTHNGSIVVNGFPSTITGNQTYALTVTVANPDGVAQFGGFQMVILDSDNMNAGTLSNPGPSSTLQTAGGRTYHEHNPAQTFPGTNVVEYTVDWTAPTGSGLISYYAAGNIANGNGNTNGDLIQTTSGSGTLQTSLSVEITNIVHVSCFEAMDGALTAEASFGAGGYTYAWSNGGSGSMITGLGPGFYTVTVTDSGGATATASAEVEEPPLFEIISSTITHVSCNGGNDGQVVFTVTGGTPPYQGAAGDVYTFGNLTAGLHEFTVMDANGCSITEQFIVTEPPAIVIDLIIQMNPLCAGDATGSISVEGSGGTGILEYSWSNGGSTNTISNLEAGTYGLTITDENGCIATESYTLTDPELLVVELVSLQQISCFGASDGQISVLGSGGTGAFSYNWSNGATTETITGLGPGSYSVTVTDENGCTDTGTYEITEPAMISGSITGTLMLQCFGDMNGTLTANINGGTSPYSYLWSNGSTMSTITGLGAGMYALTVTDANGCMLTASAEIAEPEQLLANATATNETAPGAMDGTATASPSGGTPDYSYLWSNGDTTAMITGLGPGVYTVTVTDANGCTAMQSVTVSGVNCTLEATVTTTDAQCFGDANGTATVTIMGASGAVSVLWSNGDTTAMITGLTSGVYEVTVTDSEGCVAMGSGMVGQPQELVSALTVVHESADGANDGSVVCAPSGGTSPYLFLWSNGATTDSIGGLAPGMYIVTITDNNGCTLSDTAVVNSFSCQLITDLMVMHAVCFGDSTGSASMVVTGGTEPYVISWSTGNIGTSVDMLPAGSYGVTVTDADNCITELGFAINQPDALVVQVDSIFPVTGGGDGAIFITVSGGTPPYNYMWTMDGEPVSTDEDLEDLDPGDYVVEVTDANGCTLGAGAVTVTVMTGLDDPLTEVKVEVWPNPGTEHLMIHLSGEHKISDVSIYASDGKLIRMVTPEELPRESGNLWMDISTLGRGLYYLRVRSDYEVEVLPFLKQ